MVRATAACSKTDPGYGRQAGQFVAGRSLPSLRTTGGCQQQIAASRCIAMGKAVPPRAALYNQAAAPGLLLCFTLLLLPGQLRLPSSHAFVPLPHKGSQLAHCRMSLSMIDTAAERHAAPGRLRRCRPVDNAGS